MKPCETCIHFNMQNDEYCNVEAFVEDGKGCPQYTTSCNPKRLYDILKNAQVVATEICEKASECDYVSCVCNLYDEGCITETIKKLLIALKDKLQKKTDYNREDYTKGM